MWEDSSRGAGTLSAPGADVLITDAFLDNPPSYRPGSGTSFAAPHVAGVAAMMFGKHPRLTGVNVEHRLRLTARAYPEPCPGCGIGIVDAALTS